MPVNMADYATTVGMKDIEDLREEKSKIDKEKKKAVVG